MSARRFEMHQALRVFAIITQHGSKVGDYYDFEGLQARASFDGYTVEITDGQVVLNVFFHNTYDIQFETEAQLDQFQLKLNHVEAKDKELQS